MWKQSVSSVPKSMHEHSCTLDRNSPASSQFNCVSRLKAKLQAHLW